MDSYRNLDDEHLQTLGINILTGESDQFGMRLLCDLNQAGAILVRQFFGMPVDSTFASNWNSKVNGEPSIASILLSAATIIEIQVFALALKYNTVLVYEHGMAGVFESDLTDPRYQYLVSDSIVKRQIRGLKGGINGRMEHQFSGRIS